ncbi:MAG: hypothetical protein GC206_14100 [Alphaproteobacteria bacterium]|nr:hypothetical protein [Alphaproteobacteria bacterium]
MPRGTSHRRNAKRRSTWRIAAALGAASLALSACAAFAGQERAAPRSGSPTIVAQRPNPPTTLSAQPGGSGGGLFSWAPPRQGAQPTFYYLTIEPMNGAMAPIGPLRIAATGAEAETLHALGASAGTTLVRWSVRACNDETVPALHNAPAGNCSLPASSVLAIGAAEDAATLATFTIGAGAST